MHPNVHFVADLHSRMMDTAEVAGLLAGIFDEKAKTLHIQVSAGCRIFIKFGAIYPDKRPLKSICTYGFDILHVEVFRSVPA